MCIAPTSPTMNAQHGHRFRRDMGSIRCMLLMLLRGLRDTGPAEPPHTASDSSTVHGGSTAVGAKWPTDWNRCAGGGHVGVGGGDPEATWRAI